MTMLRFFCVVSKGVFEDEEVEEEEEERMGAMVRVYFARRRWRRSWWRMERV